MWTLGDSEFQKDSLHWNGRILTGRFRHWCYDWDQLPIDETCEEFECCVCNFSNEYGLPRHFGNPETGRAK
jgi:hypothetical protein